MVHGTNRNADHYFTTATTAAFLGRALDDTVVISPRIASAEGRCHDVLDTNEVSWSCTGDSWRSGGAAPKHPDLTSFDFVDAILRKLANRSTFPNLRAIVVAGHSAGGQFVSRYEMANQVHETLGVPVTYVVANPSSYAWPDATRPMAIDDAAPESAKGGWNTDTPHTKFAYGPFDAASLCQLRQVAGRFPEPDQRIYGEDVATISSSGSWCRGRRRISWARSIPCRLAASTLVPGDGTRRHAAGSR